MLQVSRRAIIFSNIRKLITFYPVFINCAFAHANAVVNNDYAMIGKSDADGTCLCIVKYINDPMRILEVHESSRENGHGLGMWIVHNTIRMAGGDVISIDGHNGFHFNFELGEKL